MSAQPVKPSITSNQPMELANKILARIHLNYARPFQGHYFLVLIDVY